MVYRLWQLCLLLCASKAWTQVTAPVNGPSDTTQIIYAYINATIYPSPGVQWPIGTIITKGNRIWACGQNIKPPKEAVVIDCFGLHIYPSFIELNADLSLETPKASYQGKPIPGLDRNQAHPSYWNSAIRADYDPLTYYAVKENITQSYREMGFGILNIGLQEGIARGYMATVFCASESDTKVILREKTAAAFSFEKGKSEQAYPSSQMGAIALLRQSFYDAMDKTSREAYPALKALHAQMALPSIFHLADHQEIYRAWRIAQEFKLNPIFSAHGDEYKSLTWLQQAKPRLLVSLKMPEPFAIKSPEAYREVHLEQLLDAFNASANVALLIRKDVPLALTSHGLKDAKSFFIALRKVAASGVSSSEIQRALTTTPAKWMNLPAGVGEISAGGYASFFIASDSLLSANMQILSHVINGHCFHLNKQTDKRLHASWEMQATWKDTAQWRMMVDDKRAKLIIDSTSHLLQFDTQNEQVRFTFQGKKAPLLGPVRFSGTIIYKDSSLIATQKKAGKEKHLTDAPIQVAFPLRLEGVFFTGQGEQYPAVFTPKKLSETKVDSKEKLFFTHADSTQLRYPPMAYGEKVPPKRSDIFIRQIYYFDNVSDSIQKGDVFIQNGLIKAIGSKIDLPKSADLLIIDGTNKYLTSGIIDEHSHIAISKGVNEGTQAITSEVRIGDVIDAEDINIFRQLAGGVTTAQLLHGSANPIGGQSAIIKLRWGLPAQDLVMKEAPGHIKFALGENVKQSNWGERYQSRFPQSRMGVEQVFYAAFDQAKRYGAQKNKNPNLRIDLENEALLEILEGKRHITCHSYVQSEIRMLLQVADSMGFKVNTFTHVLEGYKVADELRKHGAGASTFSDWWAYKWEVNDAIPFNAGLLCRKGVLTGINSDDAEMGRRLFQEAAKSIKYTGITESEAIKMVTLNPAKMLKIDAFVGSLVPGKQADMVIWSHHPLSIMAKAEKTLIDGIIYFDRALLDTKQANDEKLKQQLVSRFNQWPEAAKTKSPEPRKQHLYHCDDLYHNDKYEIIESDF